MMTDPLIGSKLNNRYIVQNMLGHGGMGRVYLAQDERDADLVAIKRVPFSLVGPEEDLFESGLLRQLSHRNLPRVRDIFRDRNAHYLVMDFISGPTLKDLIQAQQALSPRLAALYLLDLMDVLAYLHGQSKPIIHRDIKPSNLKFQQDQRLMLVDFGISKVFVEDELTRLGAQGVTPGYAPPEQYTGGTDQRTDLYAAGAVLYYLVTGQNPLDAMKRYSRRVEQLDPRLIRPGISAELAQVIIRATALEKDARYPDARSMARDLKRALNALPEHVTPPPLPPRSIAGVGARTTTRTTLTKEQAAGISVFVVAGAILLFAIVGGLGALSRSTFIESSERSVGSVASLTVTSEEEEIPKGIVTVRQLTVETERIAEVSTYTPTPPGTIRNVDPNLNNVAATATAISSATPSPTETLLPSPTTARTVTSETVVRPSATSLPLATATKVQRPTRPPTLLSPVDGATMYGEVIRFEWEWPDSLQGEEQFELWLQMEGWPAARMVRRTRIARSDEGLRGIDGQFANHPWSWHVRVVNEVGQPISPRSETWDFVVRLEE